MLVAGIAETPPRILAHAVQGEHLDPADVVFPPPDDHSSFAGDDVLRDIKAEAAEVTERSRFLSSILGLNRVRAVFDDFQPMPVGEGHDLVHLAYAAGKV